MQEGLLFWLIVTADLIGSGFFFGFMAGYDKREREERRNA